MRGRLSRERIDELIDVAVELGFYDRRLVLLLGIPPDFRSTLPMVEGGNPGDQLASDLHWLNESRPLRDGSDPLDTWLRNAHRSAGGVQDGEVFHEALTELQQIVQRQEAPRRLLEPGGATWQPPPNHPEYGEAISHADARVSIHYLEDGQRAGESVALVSVARFEQGVISPNWHRAMGTGWLIGPRLLITAYHVINARPDGEPPADEKDFTEQALNAQVTFGYDREGQLDKVIGVTALVEQSRDLDYVILKLDADPGIAPLRLATDAPSADKESHAPLNIIQHPLGQPKMLAFRNSLATSVTELPSDLGYFTDTNKGASGAPVFNDDWRVVAMHRATAQVEVVFQGLPTAWANVGTRITAILEDLQRRSPKICRSIREGQTEASRPRLSLVRPGTTSMARRLQQSSYALRELIQFIAHSYEVGQTRWVWRRKPLYEELDRTHQQLAAIRTSFAGTELYTSRLRDLLRRHYAVADRFVQRLGDLQAPQTLLVERSMRRQEFERAGESLLELLARIQEELDLLEPGDHRPGPS
jgi:endonuclease G